jgi:protein phosphatase PTC7
MRPRFCRACLHARSLSALSFVVTSSALPREDRKRGYRPSEDAFFISAQPHLTVGISDGVGGMAARGLDPGDFARRLMAEAAFGAGVFPPAPLSALLAAAFSRVVTAGVEGAATALLCRVAPCGAVAALGLGDCTAMVLRVDGSMESSARQSVAFDTPFQLGHVVGRGAPRFDSPAAAAPWAAQLCAGDALVLCTDGLTDNLFMEDIAALARVREGAGALGLRLVRAAAAAAKDRMRDGPFALAAKDADVAWSAGGRADDITVVVVEALFAAGPAPLAAPPPGAAAQCPDPAASALVPACARAVSINK